MLTEKKVIKMYGNNKPWITSSLRKMITDKHSLFSQNSPDYKMKQIEIDAAIESAKRKYKDKVERLFHESNMRDAWKGLKMLTGQDQTKKKSPLLTEEGSTDRLIAFTLASITQISHMNTMPLGINYQKPCCDYPPIEIEENDIIEVFSKINTRKAPGPYKIGTLLLKKCIYSLLPIIHFIFQL